MTIITKQTKLQTCKRCKGTGESDNSSKYCSLCNGTGLYKEYYSYYINEKNNTAWGGEPGQ